MYTINLLFDNWMDIVICCLLLEKILWCMVQCYAERLESYHNQLDIVSPCVCTCMVCYLLSWDQGRGRWCSWWIHALTTFCQYWKFIPYRCMALCKKVSTKFMNLHEHKSSWRFANWTSLCVIINRYKQVSWAALWVI